MSDDDDDYSVVWLRNLRLVQRSPSNDLWKIKDRMMQKFQFHSHFLMLEPVNVIADKVNISQSNEALVLADRESEEAD